MSPVGSAPSHLSFVLPPKPNLSLLTFPSQLQLWLKQGTEQREWSMCCLQSHPGHVEVAAALPNSEAGTVAATAAADAEWLGWCQRQHTLHIPYPGEGLQPEPGLREVAKL